MLFRQPKLLVELPALEGESRPGLCNNGKTRRKKQGKTNTRIHTAYSENVCELSTDLIVVLSSSLGIIKL